jgi:putative PIN family toxin of toxin-antitoxin system
LDYWQAEKFDMLVSLPILAEWSRVLRYPHLAQIHQKSENDIQQLLKLVQKQAILIEPTEQLAVSNDETDNRYIECAVAGEADYLVTGDKKHLLPIGEYRGTKIITPATFLAIIQFNRK